MAAIIRIAFATGCRHTVGWLPHQLECMRSKVYPNGRDAVRMTSSDEEEVFVLLILIGDREKCS